MRMAIKNFCSIYPVDRKSRKAQSIMEYAILISVVAIALMSISLYVRRAIQANLKIIERQINSEVSTTN